MTHGTKSGESQLQRALPELLLPTIAPLLEQLSVPAHLRVLGVLDLQPRRGAPVALIGTG